MQGLAESFKKLVAKILSSSQTNVLKVLEKHKEKHTTEEKKKCTESTVELSLCTMSIVEIAL